MSCYGDLRHDPAALKAARNSLRGFHVSILESLARRGLLTCTAEGEGYGAHYTFKVRG
jgi:hypothetical protein